MIDETSVTCRTDPVLSKIQVIGPGYPISAVPSSLKINPLAVKSDTMSNLNKKVYIILKGTSRTLLNLEKRQYLPYY